MNFVSVKKTKDVHSIRQGDPGFMINDGFAQYPRAMLHVLPNCPRNIQETVNWAMANGYIKCVAYVYGKEQTMDAMR